MYYKETRPCPVCGGTLIDVMDCGYSSFNAGHVKCGQCKYTITLSCLSCDEEHAHKELIKEWNKITYNELVRQVEWLRAQLIAHGIEPGV